MGNTFSLLFAYIHISLFETSNTRHKKKLSLRRKTILPKKIYQKNYKKSYQKSFQKLNSAMAMNLTTTTSFLTIIAMFSFTTVNASPVPTKIGSSPGVEYHQNPHFLSEVDDKSPSFFESREIPSNYSQKSAENNDVKVENRQKTTDKGNFTGNF